MRNIWGGGAPTRFWEIHSLLAQKGLDITLLATPDASTYQKFDYERFPNIEIISLKIRKSSITDYIFYFKASEIVRNIANEFDIVHDDFSPMAPYSFLWKDCTVATVHEVFDNPMKRYGIAGLAPLMNDKLYCRMGYKTFITPSPSIDKELRKKGTESIIIHNGVDMQLFKPNYEHRNKDSILISMVSRFIPVKGHIFFLKMAKKLSINYKDVKFILPSTGSTLPNMRSLANELCLPIQFPGFLECDGDIARILQESNIYVNTSLQEGFGISVCNAMASGLPIVAFNVLGIRDLVTPDCGFLVPPGNVDQMVEKVKLLIEDESLRKEMGEKARDLVLRRFSWKKSAEKMMDVYKNVHNS